ncbi:unnamed protein product [Closterium sp. NIES-54]
MPLPPLALVTDPSLVAPLPPQGRAPSGVSQVDPSPLVEPVEVSSDTSGPAEGGDPTPAATVTPRCSARLAVPPGFPPRPSSPPLQPVTVDSGAAGGGATGGADSGGAGYGGAECPLGIGGTAGAGAGGPSMSRQEALSLERLCEWAVQWGSPGGGASRLRAGGAGTTGAGGAGAAGAGGSATGGTRFASAASHARTARAGGAGTTGATRGSGGAAAMGAAAGKPGSRCQEPLSPERLREWAVRWGSLGGGAGGARAAGSRGAGPGGASAGVPRVGRAGGTSSRGTGAAGGTGGAGPGGASAGVPGVGRARGTNTRGTGAAGGTGGSSPGGASAGVLGVGRAGGTVTGGTGAAGGTGGAGTGGAGPGGASAGVPGVCRAGGTVTGGTGAAGGTEGAGPGGASAGILGVGCAGGTGSGGTSAGGGTGCAGPVVGGASRQESLSPQQLREWAVRWGSPGGGAGGGGSGGAVATGARGSKGATTQPQQSALRHLLSLPPAATEFPVAGTTPPLLFPLTGQSQPQLLLGSPLLAPAPHMERVVLPPPPASSLPHVLDPESDLVCTARPTVTHFLAMVVTDPSFESTAASTLVAELVHFASLCRLEYAASLVFDSSCPPSIEGELALGCDVLEDRPFDPECQAVAVPHLAPTLLCPKGDLDALDIPTLRNYAEAITVYGLREAPCEWHDTLKTTFVALGFAPSTADPSLFLCTNTSLAPFYVLVYVDDLFFATADTKALALVKAELQERYTCTDLVLQRFDFMWSSPRPTPLSTGHSLSAPPLDESVELSGPYPELVGCLMYLMTCTQPELTYPLSLLARYVAPGRHRKVHWKAAKRVLHYLCSTSGMGLVLGGRGSVVLTGHSDASWADNHTSHRSTQGYSFSLGTGSLSWRSTLPSSVLSSRCEAEIYAGSTAAQELRWLTYLLTNLGERPRSPPVLYVDNKAMIAVC